MCEANRMLMKLLEERELQYIAIKGGAYRLVFPFSCGPCMVILDPTDDHLLLRVELPLKVAKSRTRTVTELLVRMANRMRYGGCYTLSERDHQLLYQATMPIVESMGLDGGFEQALDRLIGTAMYYVEGGLETIRVVATGRFSVEKAIAMLDSRANREQTARVPEALLELSPTSQN